MLRKCQLLFSVLPAEEGWVSSHPLHWEALSQLAEWGWGRGGRAGCLLGRLLGPQPLEVQSVLLASWRLLRPALKRYMGMSVLRAGIPGTILTGSAVGEVSFQVAEVPGPHGLKHLSTLCLPQCVFGICFRYRLPQQNFLGPAAVQSRPSS